MTCPICNRPTETAFRPFCSKRCSDIDLAKWLNGSYAIPSEDPVEPEDMVEQSPDRPDRSH